MQEYCPVRSLNTKPYDKTFWAGVYGGIIRTTDGGNFTKTAVGSIFFGIQFFDNSNGLTINSTGELFETSDGGLTWQQRLKVVLGLKATDLHFFDKDNGYLSGDMAIAKVTCNSANRVVSDQEANVFEIFLSIHNMVLLHRV